MDQQMKDFLSTMRTRVPIDRFKLPEECSCQPVLCQEIGDRVVQAKDDVNGAKDALKLLESTLMGTIRATPGAFNVDKLTEGTANAAIIRQPNYQTALEAYRSAEKIHGYLQVIQESVNQRKSQLSNLTDQFVHEFYNNADIRSSHADGERVEKAQRSTTEQAVIEKRKERNQDNKD